MSINPEELDLADPLVQLKRKKSIRKLGKIAVAKRHDVLRVVSFPFRYGLVLGLARILSPSLFHTVFNPHVYAEQRPMIRYIKRSGASSFVGAEIGVFKGHHAVSMLSYLPLKKLYLVDPYMPYVQDGVLINPVFSRRIAYANLTGFKQVCWTKASELPNGLDFIYVDSNHDYEAVKKDLELYYAKVRCGGVLGGHDFANLFHGVIRAVVEFVVKEHLELQVEQYDWWVIKK